MCVFFASMPTGLWSLWISSAMASKVDWTTLRLFIFIGVWLREFERSQQARGDKGLPPK